MPSETINPKTRVVVDPTEAAYWKEVEKVGRLLDVMENVRADANEGEPYSISRATVRAVRAALKGAGR